MDEDTNNLLSVIGDSPLDECEDDDLQTPLLDKSSVPIASSSTEFWEEFKSVTRSYDHTDEVEQMKAVCSTKELCDQLWYYLCAIIGKTSDQTDMNGMKSYIQ